MKEFLKGRTITNILFVKILKTEKVFEYVEVIKRLLSCRSGTTRTKTVKISVGRPLGGGGES